MYSGIFQRLYDYIYDDTIALRANGMCACIFLCLNFSILISNMVNINGYNPYKQKFFKIFSNF